MKELKEVTLETVAQGSAPERFQHEWQKVLENAQDPNTDPEAVRSVTLTVKMKPRPDRDSAAIVLESSSKLAPPAPVADLIYMGKQEGRLVAVGRDPSQRGLFDTDDDGEDAVVPINRDREGTTDGS